MDKALASEDHSTVVVGVDGALTSTVTVDLAVAEATRRSARLLIVHAWPGHYRGQFRLRGAHHREAEGARLLDLAAKRAIGSEPGLTVETELRAGIPGEVLADCSGRAGLLVLGHRDTQLSRPDWGSTARALALTCRSPLLVHRGRAGGRGPIVVGVSGRPGEASLGYAFTQAAVAGADLIAVHAWHRPADRQQQHPFPVTSNDPRPGTVAEPLVAALIAWSWRLPQVTAHPLVVPDLDAPYTLNRASRRARLLVAGIGGRGELTGLIAAPVSSPGGRLGPCPVLLVPPAWPVRLPPAAAVASAAISP
ncbi:universal stress protein [Actinoplanes sp. HUAS TT8]|uniref:universal stress protein n=1 Tax=Actinoplanes sp. HUAS TT8 TaxID=3447453 RepID=UPI003F51C6FB